MHSTSNRSQFAGPSLIAPAPPPSYVDPAQTHTHSHTTSRPPSAPKRKRLGTPEESGAESANGSGPGTANGKKGRDGPKKKKASRACFHCQKAHLTCDDSRPCQRCLKRGIGSNCTEGHRKKAKYLLDEEELERIKGKNSNANGKHSSAVPESEPSAEALPKESHLPPSSAPNTTTTSTAPATNPPSEPILAPNPQPSYETDFSFAFPSSPGATSPSSFGFGSAAANLEYSILSAILGNPSPPEADWLSSGERDHEQEQSDLERGEKDTDGNTSSMDAYQMQQPPPPLHPLQPRPPLQNRPPSPLSAFLPDTPVAQPQPQSYYPTPYYGTGATGMSSLSGAMGLAVRPSSGIRGGASSPSSNSSLGSHIQTINDRVTAPYDYTESYHFLMKHLPGRFEKNDILRVVRALAIFRPSLIALQMPLSEEDEVFVERCFQRSLLELDKLISFSGTPTVAWRRTGEICLVAPEFCALTDWPMDELVGRRKYIYELFENQSVVEYWENFASHAFENTTQSVHAHCVLLKPNGAPVPATFCFSIRRDIFDLPSLVIGQWLPLL